MEAKKIGIIGGLGHLGSLLGKAALDSGVAEEPLRITTGREGTYARIDEVYEGHRSEVEPAENNQDLAAESDWVVVSVLPQQFEEGIGVDLSGLPGVVVISPMAGVTVDTIAEGLHARGNEIVRIMPDVGLEQGTGVVGIYFPEGTSAATQEGVRQFVNASGQMMIVEVDSDDAIDRVTAVSGSAPGPIARFLDTHRRILEQNSAMDRVQATRAAFASLRQAVDTFESHVEAEILPLPVRPEISSLDISYEQGLSEHTAFEALFLSERSAQRAAGRFLEAHAATIERMLQVDRALARRMAITSVRATLAYLEAEEFPNPEALWHQVRNIGGTTAAWLAELDNGTAVTFEDAMRTGTEAAYRRFRS